MPTPEEQLASMIASLAEKTGRSLDEWVALVATSGLEKHGEMVNWLKTEHGVTHGYANLIVHTARQADAPAEDDLVAAQYEGKQELRPLYDRLMKEIGGFGPDVEVAPKKGYVSLRRSKQFALIQPSTRTRMDVGLKLPDREPEGRLEAAGSWNAMVSHRVRVTDPGHVDDELVGWLREAYEGA